MKRFLSLLVALFLVGAICMVSLSEGTDASSGDSAGIPAGDDASSGDSAGDSAGDSSGMPADGTIPDMGEIPADADASSGDSAGASSGMGGDPVEGQLGSWNGGGTNADAVEGNDYAYDAALFVSAEGIDAEKSAADRIQGGAYDALAASGLVINDSEAGHNGVIVVNS